jgi:hypothetical protein
MLGIAVVGSNEGSRADSKERRRKEELNQVRLFQTLEIVPRRSTLRSGLVTYLVRSK